MNKLKHEKNFEIAKDVITYLFCKIYALIILCFMLNTVIGLQQNIILYILYVTIISYVIMEIAIIFKTNTNNILNIVRKKIYIWIFILLFFLYEYLINDPLHLKKIRISNRIKIYVCACLMLSGFIIRLIQNKMVHNVYQKHMDDERYIRHCSKIYHSLIRKTGKSRCPWCGELSDIRANAFRQNTIKSDKCNICGRYAIPYNNVLEKILNPGIDIAIWVLLIFIRRFLLLAGIIYLMAKLFYYNFFRNYVPYKRINGKDKNTRVSEEKLKEEFLFNANIKFCLPLWKIFKFWNNRILIIIAVDESGTAISHPLCVRIIRDRNKFKLTKIVNPVKFNSSDCKRFFVYLGDDKIGEGTVAIYQEGIRNNAENN